MARLLLTDDEWELIADVFPEPAATGRPPAMRGRCSMASCGCCARGLHGADLPEEFGAWKTAWRMFDTWTADGTLAEILHRLPAAFVAAGAIDHPLWCIDGTTVRAARCAAGGGKKTTRKSFATTL